MDFKTNKYISKVLFYFSEMVNKSCGLIIADLSSANINVYHEIGYAMGIAESNNMIPNIILLYKENTDHNKDKKDIDKFVGFNLRNLSQLRFREYDQLVEGLVKRLESIMEYKLLSCWEKWKYLFIKFKIIIKS